MVHLYTRTGDGGETFCFAMGGRVKKYSLLIELVGTLDEANSALGLAISFCREECHENHPVRKFLEEAQRMVFNVGFIINGTNKFTGEEVSKLEELADKFMEGFEFKGFILPRGTKTVSAIHLARSILRRAERRFFEAMDKGMIPVNSDTQYAGKLLNRLSDTLFAAAINIAQKERDVEFV